jgi:hypothetical protein
MAYDFSGIQNQSNQYNFAGIAPKPAQKSNYYPGFSEVAGFTNYMMKGVGDVVGNTAKFAGDTLQYTDPIKLGTAGYEALTGQKTGYVSPVKMLGEGVKSITDKAGENIEMVTREGGGITKDSMTAKLGEGTGWLAGNIGLSLAGGQAGAKAGQVVGNLASRYAKFIPKVGQYIEPATKLIGSSLGATQGGVTANEGRAMTPEEAATGLAIDTTLFGAGKLLQGLSKRGLRQIPQFTNKQASQAEISKLGNLLYENVENLPMTSNRPTLGAKIADMAQDAYRTKTGVIEQVSKSGLPTTTSGARVNQILDDAYKSATSQAAIKEAGISLDQVPGAMKKLDQIKGFYKEAANRGYSLAELEKFKESFGSKLFANSATEKLENIYRKSIRSGLKNEAESIVGSASQDALKTFKKAKGDYSVLKKAAKRMTHTPKAYSGFLSDVILGGAAGSSDLGRGDFGSALKNALTAIAIKRGLKSPVGSIGLARTLKTAQPFAMPVVQSARNLILGKQAKENP